MRSFNILQYLMTDSLSLQAYRNKRILSVRDLGDNIYEQMHHACRGIPEHYIAGSKKNWLWLEEAGKNTDQLRDVFVKLLPRYVANYLEEANRVVYLKPHIANDWQLIVQLMSPLLMISSYLYHKFPVNIKSEPDIRDLILLNTLNSALPRISQETLNKYGGDGIRDMHLHLFAMMEADRAVLDLMRSPSRILGSRSTIAETTIQACGYISRDEINKDISRLCKLEFLLAEKVFCGKSISKDEFTHCLCDADFRYDRSDDILNLYVKDISGLTDLQFEALLIHRSLFGLSKDSGSQLSVFCMTFHAYLLLYGRLRSFAVMQQGDAGLMGLNRYFGYGLRREDKNVELENFLQLVGNSSQQIKYIDLRFGGLKPADIEKLKNSERSFHEQMQPDAPRIAHVALIAKKPDQNRNAIRNEELRKHIKDYVIPSLCSAEGKSLYNAVDVAGRDYEVRPDVFAGLYDELRNAGYKQFSYHAGEDFYHLLGGLRAIYEAVEFLKLTEGCRIGHASAAGVAPHLWSDILGGEIEMKIGEYLDDLIFTRFIIQTLNVPIPKTNKTKIKNRIEELSRLVYGRHCDVSDLTEAWLMRKQEPSDYIYKSNLTEIEKLAADYHKIEVRERYDKNISVKCYEMLNESHMIRLQRAILGMLADKGIAIEVMPTSNIYIGLHQSFHSYHLKQWIDWKFSNRFNVRMPAIVIGSDEPGILCTNIMTEYAHICNMLESANDMLLSKRKISDVLRTLASDSKKYEFK